MAHHTLHFETADVVVTSCRSILCRNLHSDGIQLHVGEHLLVKSHDNEIQVIQALQFFSLCHNRQYFTFVKGRLFVWPDDRPVHLYSSNKIIKPSSQVIVSLATEILRKIILLPDPDSLIAPACFIVLDYYRTILPCSDVDIIIPVYPKINDMIQVCGSDDEIWFGHVLSVDTVNKTCRVNFYIEDCHSPGRYKQESFGRLSRNIVQWESIIRICHGHWSNNNRFWYQEH